MAELTAIWTKVFTTGTKTAQERLKKAHAKNPEFAAWFEKHSEAQKAQPDAGKSASKAKKVKPSATKKTAPVSDIRAINAARMKKYYDMGGRQPIGAGGSGGHSPMAGMDQSTVKGIVSGIKAGINPKVAEEIEHVEEGRMKDVITDREEAERLLGGPVKLKSAVVGGKGQPKNVRNLTSRLARSAIRRAMEKELTYNPHYRTEEVVNEEPKKIEDVGEYDYEGDMAMSQLKSIMSNAKKLHDMLEPNTNLPEWVQSKITLAEDYIVTAANYMEGRMNEEVEQVEEGKNKPYVRPFRSASGNGWKAMNKHGKTQYFNNKAAAEKHAGEGFRDIKEEVEQIEEGSLENKAKKKEFVRKLGLRAMRAGKVDRARGYIPQRAGREVLKGKLGEEALNEYKVTPVTPKGISSNAYKAELEKANAAVAAEVQKTGNLYGDAAKREAERQALLKRAAQNRARTGIPSAAKPGVLDGLEKIPRIGKVVKSLRTAAKVGIPLVAIGLERLRRAEPEVAPALQPELQPQTKPAVVPVPPPQVKPQTKPAEVKPAVVAEPKVATSPETAAELNKAAAEFNRDAEKAAAVAAALATAAAIRSRVNAPTRTGVRTAVRGRPLRPFLRPDVELAFPRRTTPDAYSKFHYGSGQEIMRTDLGPFQVHTEEKNMGLGNLASTRKNKLARLRASRVAAPVAEGVESTDKYVSDKRNELRESILNKKNEILKGK